MNEGRRDPDEILLAHGSGGRLTNDLVRNLFLPRLGNPALAALEDAARLSIDGRRIAFTTDSFVVSPVFFPGGDLGKLSICGTVNDLAVMGGRPIALSAGFLIEEGLPTADLTRLVDSMRATCLEVGVPVVTGDTKVVEKGGLDRIFINTAGIGVLEDPLPEGQGAIRPGDRVILSGGIAEHGMAVLSARNDLGFETPIVSDCAPVWGMVQRLLAGCPGVRWMRDPTRGGIATTLNELTGGAAFGIELSEDAIPMKPEVHALAEILGLDPLYVASEGRILVLVSSERTSRALELLRSHPLGCDAQVIGEVREHPAGCLVLRTRIGGTRLLDLLTGEQLPRIC